MIFYREPNGAIPLLEWLSTLTTAAVSRCLARLERLAEIGHELRRPEADYLGDGIYELRAKHHRVNYRMLYFFHGRTAVVVSHGLSKQQRRVPTQEISAALTRKKAFEDDPWTHTFRG